MVVAMHWFRKGLRLVDNPALQMSLLDRKGETNDDVALRLYPVYVLDGDSYQLKHCTALRANFLIECLQDLDQRLRERHSRLFCPRGDPVEVLPALWKQWGVTHMAFEKDETGEPYATQRDERVLAKARACGIHVTAIASETLHPLEKYTDYSSTSSSSSSSVNGLPITMGSFQSLFAKFKGIAKPMEAPSQLPPPGPTNNNNNDWCVPQSPTDLPWPRGIPRSRVTPVWNQKDCENLTPIVRGGETAALAQLHRSVTQRPAYVATFEKPQTSCVETQHPFSTTVLSPYLSLGCLSPRTVWYAIEESSSRSNSNTTRSRPPVSLHGQLLWRDFNNLMAHSANRCKRGSWGRVHDNVYCRDIPWSDDPERLRAWQEGRTGYPWIDACLKQLETEGWIHHLGRHAVACFLTRGDLWQSWEKGAHHFESRLLDADYALNGFNWLWLSCSGFFYQYFRCYGPVSFQQKNDPTGRYIRRYLPVLEKLPNRYIYEPWKAPMAVQQQAGIRIGVDYPKPIVEHSVVSKENMKKMALAYEPYKKTTTKKKKKKESSSKRKARGDPPSKTTKKSRQSKLKF